MCRKHGGVREREGGADGKMDKDEQIAREQDGEKTK